MPENFVICRCQHCDGHIEFDASDFAKGETRTVECPHCKLETLIFVPVAPKPSPVPPIQKTQYVKGTVLDFTIQTNSGIISGDDGQRYSFQGADWRDVGKYPAKGMRVDFSPQAGCATVIYSIQDIAVATQGTKASKSLPPVLLSKPNIDIKTKSSMRSRNTAIVIAGVMCILICILFLIGFLQSQRVPSGPPSDNDVYSCAVDYIKGVYPQAQCSSFSESSVTHDYTNQYTVSVLIYGVHTVNYGDINRMWVKIDYDGRRLRVSSASQS
jgi:hypothetical protein